MSNNGVYGDLDFSEERHYDVDDTEDISQYVNEEYVDDYLTADDDEIIEDNIVKNNDDNKIDEKDEEIIDDNNYNEPYISKSFLDVSDKLKDEFYTKFAKRENNDALNDFDFKAFTKRAIEVLREDFAKTTLEKARQTTIQQSKSILDVFKSHILHDNQLKKRLEQKFGRGIIQELEAWDKSKNDKELEKFTYNTVEINNTSLFLEIARYLFSPYIQFPELFADDKPDKVSVAEVFNYANVIEIEKTTNDDIQKQFTRFETDDKIQKLFMNNKDLEGIYEKIKYDSYKIHTYFSVFILLWSSPFDERDYGIQQYSKSIALLSEKMVQFIDNLNNLDKLYPKSKFNDKINEIVQKHIDSFDDGLKSLDNASTQKQKKILDFMNGMDSSLTQLQKLQRELGIVENFGVMLKGLLSTIDENTAKALRANTSMFANDNSEVIALLKEINKKLDIQGTNITTESKVVNNVVEENIKEPIIPESTKKSFLQKIFNNKN